MKTNGPKYGSGGERRSAIQQLQHVSKDSLDENYLNDVKLN